MNKITIFLVVVIMALSFYLGTTMSSKAQERSYSGIIPFVTGNDRVGFLDQSTGRVFVYDNNIVNCVFVGQIESLGKPIRVVSSNTSTEPLYR
jgi:hypothetical protein